MINHIEEFFKWLRRHITEGYNSRLVLFNEDYFDENNFGHIDFGCEKSELVKILNILPSEIVVIALPYSTTQLFYRINITNCRVIKQFYNDYIQYENKELNTTNYVI